MTDEERAALTVKVAELDYETARGDMAERIKIQWSIADATMKALLLANGGAMIALFTFVGNLIARSTTRPAFHAEGLRWAFACFVTGLVLALLTHAAAFVSQEQFMYTSAEESWRQQRIMTTQVSEPPSAKELMYFGRAKIFYTAAFGLAILSVVAFGIGCWKALWSLIVS